MHTCNSDTSNIYDGVRRLDLVDKPGVTRQRQAIFNTYNHYLDEIGLGSTCSSVINAWNNRSRCNGNLTESLSETGLQSIVVKMLTLL